MLLAGIFIYSITENLPEKIEERRERALYESDKAIWQRLDELESRVDVDVLQQVRDGQEVDMTDPNTFAWLTEIPPEDDFNAMIQRRAHFEAKEEAIAYLQAKAAERGPPSKWVRFYQVLNSPIVKLSNGILTLDTRSQDEIEAERREYPKTALQDLLEGAFTLGVLIGIGFLLYWTFRKTHGR